MAAGILSIQSIPAYAAQIRPDETPVISHYAEEEMDPVLIRAVGPEDQTATASVTEHMETDAEGNEVERKETEKGKEFFTIRTDSGKTFYLVIDRSKGGEQVHFLTEICDYDLLNVTGDLTKTETIRNDLQGEENIVQKKEIRDVLKEFDELNGTEDSSEAEEKIPQEEEAKQQAAKLKRNQMIFTGGGLFALLLGILAYKKFKKKDEDFNDGDEEDMEGDEELEGETEEENEEDETEADEE